MSIFILWKMGESRYWFMLSMLPMRTLPALEFECIWCIWEFSSSHCIASG